MAFNIAFAVSKRLQVVAAALLCLVTAQFVVASCTPEPTFNAARVMVSR